jgi:hypothetical protein
MADAAVESLAVPMSGVEAAPQSAAPDYTGFDYPDVAFIDQAVISNAGDARGALKDLAGLPNLAEDLPGRVDLNTDRVTSNANIDQVTASLPFPGGVTLTKGERQPIQDSTRSVDSKQDKAEARQSDFDMAAQRVKMLIMQEKITDVRYRVVATMMSVSITLQLNMKILLMTVY